MSTKKWSCYSYSSCQRLLTFTKLYAMIQRPRIKQEVAKKKLQKALFRLEKVCRNKTILYEDEESSLCSIMLYFLCTSLRCRTLSKKLEEFKLWLSNQILTSSWKDCVRNFIVLRNLESP